MTKLHYTQLEAKSVTSQQPNTQHWIVFLHGILGSGVNFRSFAQAWLQRNEDWGALLVDLRMHGQSLGLPAPHTLQQAAADLEDIAAEIPFEGIIGHSFGGKVALAYQEICPELKHLWVIDANPGVISQPGQGQQVSDLIRIMRALQSRRFAERKEFTDALLADGHSKAIAQWAAMNLVADGDTFRLRLDVQAIESLFSSHRSTDLWQVIERPRGETAIHLVIAGKSDQYEATDKQRAKQAAQRFAKRHLHEIPESGHWVHVDQPEQLLAVTQL